MAQKKRREYQDAADLFAAGGWRPASYDEFVGLTLCLPRIERRQAIVEAMSDQLRGNGSLSREWAEAAAADPAEVDALHARTNAARLHARAAARMARGKR